MVYNWYYRYGASEIDISHELCSITQGATEVRVMAQKAAKDMKKQQTKKRQKRAVEQDR